MGGEGDLNMVGVRFMIRTMALVILLSVAGGVTANEIKQINTLADNDAIENSLIESQVDDETAGILLDTPYKGFYQIQSRIKHTDITFGKIVPQQSFPDERWADLASQIASMVKIKAYTTGTRIDPKATAYVVFYDVYMPGLDRDNIILLPTSTLSQPNTLAVLVIEHQNHSITKDISGWQTGSADQNGNKIYFFELAM